VTRSRDAKFAVLIVVMGLS